MGSYAEFLTSLAGGDYDRVNKRRATVEIAGVAAQQLRYLELLLQSPWHVDIRTDDFDGRVRVANPVGFLAQKVLIHNRRDYGDRAKDILYMHDTLECELIREHRQPRDLLEVTCIECGNCVALLDRGSPNQ